MTTYDFDFIIAGRNAGWKPWRGHTDPEFVYQLRELNEDTLQPAGFQLVKINVETGAIVASGPQWLSPGYGTFGACYVTPTAIHTAGVNLTSVSSSTKLYLFGSSGFGAGPYNHVVIEFDKTTLDVTNHWVVGPVGTDTKSRDRGVAVTNLAGTILANAGNSDLGIATFTTSYIDMFKPSDGTYLRVALNADLGITGILGLYFSYDAPICFDQDGFLWFITTPWADGAVGRPDRSTGPSSLHKCSVNAATLALTLVQTYAIPDNFYIYDHGAGVPLSFSETYGFRRMVCNPVTEKILLWSDWRTVISGDASEGWFWEWDTNTNTFTRGPSPWLSGQHGDISQKLDSIGFSVENYLVAWKQNPAGFLNSVFNIFKISDATERTVLINANFAVNQALNEATFFHSFIGNSDVIYAMDIDFITVSGWQYYRDGLFSIIEPAPEPATEGGSGMQMLVNINIRTPVVFTPECKGLNSVLELGPFRWSSGKWVDETSTVTAITLGLSSADFDIITEEDWDELTGEEDWDTAVDVLGEDIEEDWGDGIPDPDEFKFELLACDDGMFPNNVLGIQELQPFHDQGSTKIYVPEDFSGVYHRIRLSALECDQYFSIKFLDVGGLLTGRLANG